MYCNRTIHSDNYIRLEPQNPVTVAIFDQFSADNSIEGTASYAVPSMKLSAENLHAINPAVNLRVSGDRDQPNIRVNLPHT